MWGQNYLSASHRAPTLSAPKGGFSISRSWQRLYLGKGKFCLCCNLLCLWCLNAKTGYSTVNVKKIQNAGELILLKRRPLPTVLKLQNGLLDRRSEVLLSPVCNRETEAWQAWVTSTRSYMPVGVLGIKPRSFWHIETQAYISYRLGRLRMLSSPPLTVCATETAFVLCNLLPNISNITSAVNCKTRAQSLRSTCPASMWLFLLAARLDFL